MQKDPTLRYASAHDLLRDLESVRATMRSSTTPAQIVSTVQPRARLNRSTVAIGTAAVLIMTVVGVWFASRAMRARETQQRVDEIRRLVESEQNEAALRRLHTLPATLADDPEVVKLRNEFFVPLAVRTDPSDADIYFKGYREPDAEWVHLGRSPIDTRGTQGLFRWRVSKAGYETFEGTGLAGAVGEVRFVLRPAGTTPEGMLRIRGGNVSNAGRIPDFFIDKYELTNQEFKRFVDSGGYRNAQYWQEPFVRDGQALSWDQAIIQFRDATGRPGPATWELGTYPEGQDDWPVRGLSWYEAAAYARFAGKALPTVHHWQLGAAVGIFSDILEWSNFSGKGPARVGEFKGIGPHGTYDMAGNVKEWCANPVGDRRYILGGGWNEPNYQYRQVDARLPFDRSENNGVRLVKLADPSAVPVAAYNPIERLTRDYSQEKPVGDEVLAAFARLYSYDASNLQAVVESVNESSSWRVERVVYNAAYGGERIPAYLFLPKNVSPPYQTIVYFPHAGGTVLDSFQQAEMAYLGFLVKAGRALLFPMYKGTYDRRLKTPAAGPNALRDLIIQQVKDVSRSVDYLQSRPDIAGDRLGYFGVSMGAITAPMVLAVEKRFKTAVLWSGGFPSTPRPPEIDAINFAPRVATPVLMLNGRDDFTFPIETSQEPMYRLLGTPAADKQRGVYEGGHVFPFSRMIKDSLDWLDRYLGTPK